MTMPETTSVVEAGGDATSWRRGLRRVGWRLPARSLPIALSLLNLSLSVSASPLGSGRTEIPLASSHAPAPRSTAHSEVVREYCVWCHNDTMLTGGMSLQSFDVSHPESKAPLAEKMVRKLRAGLMPPKGAFQPEPEQLLGLVEWLEESLDASAVRDPGSRPFQRLNRAEYARLIDEILGLKVDPSEWLPSDQISAGFDNIADVQTMSATLMEAYLTAAGEIARRAIGQEDAPAQARTYTNPPSVSQHEWERVEGAPYGTRGGISVLHTFPADGEYTVSMGFMSGWGERFHDVDVSIDGQRVALLRYGGDIDFQGRKDFPIETEPIFIRAGQRRVSAAFVRQMDGPYEDLIRPNDWSLTGTETSYGTTSPPHMLSLTLEGPYNPVGVSPSATRQRVFTCRPTSADEEVPCARSIVKGLATVAYRRDVEEEEVLDLMDFYRAGAAESGFEAGIRTALEAILSSPHFLFRMEREPQGIQPGQVYPLAGLELASRLSFFLWGSRPDEELLQAAGSGKLNDPAVLEAEARRMLKDPRSESLATRFGSLWLRLQDLERVSPDAFWFPNYSRQLMEAMRRETEIFFDNLVREDRSLLELYGADYTFLNERLARHYGIDGVAGEEFRRIDYPNQQRRGILGHGSILVQTSLGNRTSPVLRGKWVMEVLLGTPPPPPPPGIPDLEETEATQDGEVLTTRRRLELHRKNPSCSSCHNLIDPIGLALDNFSVTGKWRIRENGVALDTRGTFYDGTDIESPADLSRVLLKRPIPLVRQFTENLMAYALGRRVTHLDQPVIRGITKEAAANGYRMSSFILGVVKSEAFGMKRASEPTEDAVSEERSR